MIICPTTITQVDVYGYDLTYVHGQYAMSGGRSVTVLPSTVVRITTAGGLSGFGEVCPLGAAYLPGFATGARAALRELAPQLIGLDATNLGLINDVMDKALRGHLYAKSPVDIACWDVFGRSVGVPVCALLGGILQERFPLYTAVPLAQPGEMASYVRERKAEGIGIFQLKLGARPHDDLARIEAVVAVTGRSDVVVADANGGWRLQAATVAANLFRSFDAVYLEQPCATLEECLALRRLTSLPIVLDEVITDVQTLVRAYTANGMDGINLKISRVGGLTKAKLIRDIAVAVGLRLTIEDTWGGDLTTAAVSHLAASTPPEAFLAASFMNDWTSEHVAGYSPRSQGGVGSAPLGPGLGIDVELKTLSEPLVSIA